MANILGNQANLPVQNYTSRISTQGDIHWRIETIEPLGLNFQNFIVQGQFPVDDDGVTFHDAQVIPEVASYGVPQPFIQWVRGELQTVKFNVILYSRDSQEDINKIYKDMRRLQTWTPELRRTPICRFTYGSILSMKCLVRGFGDVKISRPKPDGSARKIEFSITLARFKPFTLNEIDVTKPQSESRMQICSGETRMYEFLAMKEYGVDNTIFGDRLRKRNRKNGFAVPDGERTKVPSAKVILKEKIVQDFHGFRKDNPAVANMLNDRIQTRRNRVLVV
jgi:hypothetical protein